MPTSFQRKLIRDFASLALSVLIISALAQAQSESGGDEGINFQGEVRYEDNTPAQFVPVELWTDGESSWRIVTKTDPFGKFHVGAPCMMVQYKVDTTGYRPVWGRVDMSTNPCRAHEWITLKATPETKARIAGTPASGVVDARIAAIPAEARTEFDSGQKAIADDDFSGAIPHLQKAISLYPRYAEAYQLLGVAQLQTQQGAQAETSLLKAIEIEDRMPQAQYLLGVLLAKTNRADKAEKPLQRFAELDPENPEAHFELAKVSFALSKFAEAEARARTAIKLKEPNPGVYIVLGYALLRQEKAADAKHAFRQYLRLDPDSLNAADIRNLVAQIDQRAHN